MTTFHSEPSGRPHQWRRIAAIIAASVVILVGVAIQRARSFDGGPLSPNLGSIQGLPIALPNGRTARLGDIIKPGIPTVLNLWASWCGPCRLEGPHLAELRQEFGPTRLNLVLLNVRDRMATPRDREAFLKAVGLPADAYAILEDRRVRELARAEDNLIPRTFIFDRSGAALGTITGYKPMALSRVAGFVE